MRPDSIRVALLITDALERLSIAYAVEGSLANSVYGIARSSIEANIIADMRPEHVEPFVASLARDFYADPHRIQDAIAQRGSFSLVHYASKFNVDVIIPQLRPFDQMQLQRRKASVISTDPPRQVSVTSPEDAILSKLERILARRGGPESAPGSPRPLAEVAAMLKAQAGLLDLVYLRRWAKELNIEALLERALKQP